MGTSSAAAAGTDLGCGCADTARVPRRGRRATAVRPGRVRVEEPLRDLDLPSAFRFEDCRAAGMVLPASDAGILAQCRSQLAWHERHQFCSACGTRSTQTRGGHVRICPNCNAQHFPRTDPVAIMVISDGNRCLLGQAVGRLARTGMYSALAGFIDQGESIEEAVRREVREEAGVEVGAVRYHSSQPWPFPSSLMIGCHGEALTTDIRIDPVENGGRALVPAGRGAPGTGRGAPDAEGAGPHGHRAPPDPGLGRRGLSHRSARPAGARQVADGTPTLVGSRCGSRWDTHSCGSHLAPTRVGVPSGALPSGAPPWSRSG